MSAPDCTCVPLYQTIDGGVSIHWIVAHCPLHAAAKRVYEALSKAYRQYNDPCGKCWGGFRWGVWIVPHTVSSRNRAAMPLLVPRGRRLG